MSTLKSFDEILITDDDELVVMATSNPGLQARQLVIADQRRFVVRQAITKEQFQQAEARNRRVREKFGRPHGKYRWLARGETPLKLERACDQPASLPEDSAFFYWLEELP